MRFFNTFDFIENFFPNTPLAFLIFLFSFVLITAVFILIIPGILKEKKDNGNKTLTVDDLIKIVNNEKSDIKDLVFALEYFNDKFKVKNFPDKSLKFFKLLLTHKNRGKILFDIFHNKTVNINKDFKKELNEIESKALNK